MSQFHRPSRPLPALLIAAALLWPPGARAQLRGDYARLSDLMQRVAQGLLAVAVVGGRVREVHT